MNQNPVKLLWGLWACQPPPSILIAPGRCNSACSPYCSQESKPPALGVWVLLLDTMLSTSWYRESASAEQRRWRRAAEGLSAVWALECVCQVTELDTCSLRVPSLDSLIPCQVAIHSYLRNSGRGSVCACWGRGQRVPLGQQEKGKSRKGQSVLFIRNQGSLSASPPS